MEYAANTTNTSCTRASTALTPNFTSENRNAMYRSINTEDTAIATIASFFISPLMVELILWLSTSVALNCDFNRSSIFALCSSVSSDVLKITWLFPSTVWIWIVPASIPAVSAITGATSDSARSSVYTSSSAKVAVVDVPPVNSRL